MPSRRLSSEPSGLSFALLLGATVVLHVRGNELLQQVQLAHSALTHGLVVHGGVLQGVAALLQGVCQAAKRLQIKQDFSEVLAGHGYVATAGAGGKAAMVPHGAYPDAGVDSLRYRLVHPLSERRPLGVLGLDEYVRDAIHLDVALVLAAGQGLAPGREAALCQVPDARGLPCRALVTGRVGHPIPSSRSSKLNSPLS